MLLMFLRRLILVTLVLIPLIYILAGCASVDVQCDMRVDYRSSPIPAHGKTTFAWSYGQGFLLPTQYGEAIASDITVIRLRGDPPTFNDICGLARLGHEVAHAMGGRH